MHRFLSIVLLPLMVLMPFIGAIPTIQAVGSKFFTSEGKQWYIKGIAYQLIEDDPLVDVAQCTKDAALMKQLGANAIRVYHVDASADHSGCMDVFANAGIYLFVDLDSFKTYIRYDSTPSWTQNKSDSYRAVMDNFQQYDNTAGFFVGNEVLNSQVDSGSAPYILAAVVDLKAYRQQRGYRTIPIGYSATDTGALPMLQDYFACRPNVTERLEFYSLNSYRWCGSSATYDTSGYNQLQAASLNYPMPIFFSETGCNTVPPRTFDDQAAILGPDMDGTWSGAIIYEWIQEINNYGLINYGAPAAASVQNPPTVIDGFTRQGVPTPIQPDFGNLQAQWSTLNPTGVPLAQYTATMKLSSVSCPAYTAGGWTVDPSSPLPTLNQAAVPAATSSTRTTTGSNPVSAVTTIATTTPSGSATASASKGVAVRAISNPLYGSTTEAGVLGVTGFFAIMVAVVMCWL